MNKKRVNILYTTYKKINSKLDNDYIIIQKIDFDDFGYKTLCNLSVIKEGKVYSLSDYKILIEHNKNTHKFLKESLKNEIIKGYFEFDLEETKFISLGSFETYKQLKEILNKSQFMYFLEKMNDLVYVKNIKKRPWELFESIVMPGVEESLLRKELLIFIKLMMNTNIYYGMK